jgi:two-component system OmpR family sensor kinase
MLPHIFERFYRGEVSRSGPGGAGLGLAIAKELVEAQDGTIHVESTPGQGSQFTVLLPVAAP